MSELKAISGHEIREDIDYNTRGIDPENKEWCNYGKELCDTQYYLKSEADKVIADLEESHKKEVEQLLIEIVKLKEQVHEYALGLHVMQAKAEKETRHSNYKRCLAMARWCDSEMNYWYDRIEMEQCKRFKFYDKWLKRWLKIAEQFKEAE